MGYETGCGDPLLVDAADQALPVLTAMHGEDVWEPMLSVEVFAKCFEEFAHISEGRSNPVEQESNPLPDVERKRFLRRVSELNEGKIEPKFWDALLEF